MRSSRSLFAAVWPTALVLAAVMASPTLAADRFVEPDGNGPADTCPADNPCEIVTAISSAAAGDHVKLLPGTITVPATVKVQPSTLTIEPAVPGTRPTLTSSANNGAALDLMTNDNSATVIKGIEITSSSNADATHEALRALSPVTMSDVVLQGRGQVLSNYNEKGTAIADVTVEQTGGTGYAVWSDAPGTVIQRMTVAAAPGSDGLLLSDAGSEISDSSISGGAAGMLLISGAAAQRVSASGTALGIEAAKNTRVTNAVATVTGAGVAFRAHGGDVTMRNVTAVGTAPGSIGLLSIGPGTNTTARNVIAEGALHDVQAADSASLTIDHSQFSTQEGPVVDGGENRTSDPIFVNADTGDLHPGPGADAIDHGAADDLIGATDRDGQPRVQGTAPDIGAFEATPVVLLPGPPPSAQTLEDPPIVVKQQPQPTTPDTTAPRLLAVSISTKRGQSAKVTLTLDEVAAVHVVLRKAVGGKRRGPACVAATTKLRKAKRCTRQVTLAAARQVLPAGAGVISVGHRLRSGAYRATITATDAAGNRGQSTTTVLTIR